MNVIFKPIALLATVALFGSQVHAGVILTSSAPSTDLRNTNIPIIDKPTITQLLPDRNIDLSPGGNYPSSPLINIPPVEPPLPPPLHPLIPIITTPLDVHTLSVSPDGHYSNTIHINGSIYVDIAVLASISSYLSLQANNVVITPSQLALPTSGYTQITLDSDPFTLNATGDYLFYSGNTPIEGIQFVATDNIYIGNFVSSVPLPSALTFMVSGLLLAANSLRKRA